MTPTTKSFQIENASTGHIFGIYEGETEEQAIAAMMLDSGSTDEPSDDIVATWMRYSIRPLGQCRYSMAATKERAISDRQEARDLGLRCVSIIDMSL